MKQELKVPYTFNNKFQDLTAFISGYIVITGNSEKFVFLELREWQLLLFIGSQKGKM